MSTDIQLPDPNADWSQSLNSYLESRRQIKFKTPMPHYVKHKEIKEKDTQYNPVLQTYTNTEIERAARNQDNKALIEVLARNRVRSPLLIALGSSTDQGINLRYIELR